MPNNCNRSLFNLHTFANFCVSDVGHHTTYQKMVLEAARSLGGNGSAYIPRQHSISSLPEGFCPRFEHPEDATKKMVLFSQFWKTFRVKDGRSNIFFIETFNRRTFRYFSQNALLHGTRRDGIWILFRDDHCIKGKRDKREILHYLKKLSKKFGTRLQLLTDSLLIAHYLEEAFQMPLSVVPIPHTCEAAQESAHRYLFVGEPRKEKGGHLIKPLFTLEDTAAQRAELMVATAFPCVASTNGLTVLTHPHPMTTSTYFKTLGEARFFLLPYEPYRYRRRTSGIFVECLLMGKVPLVHKETWMADELARFGLSELVVDFENPLFFTHADHLYSRADIRERLEKMHAHYREYHTVKSYAEVMHRLLTAQGL